MTDIHLLSIQVGLVQEHTFPNGENWSTAYAKKAVQGSVQVHRLGVNGDQQKNKRVHGGEHRAILMYSADHYVAWEQELGIRLPYGAFAENFTISHIDEDHVCIGDIFAIGPELLVEVSQPRQPCKQINQYWQREDLTQQVDVTGRTGWYLRVLHPGSVEVGMPVKLQKRPYSAWNIRRTASVYQNRHRAALRTDAAKLSEIEALQPDWRRKLYEAANK